MDRATDGGMSHESAITLRETPCLLCGSTRHALVIEAPDHFHARPKPRFQVVRCEECGLVFTNPRPLPEDMGQFYAADYAPHHKAQGGANKSWRRHFPQSLAGRNPHRFLPLHGQGRLLDFGCGSGVFLSRMKAQGWTTTGLDFSAAVAERVGQVHGIEVKVGTLPHPGLREESFDMVTMWQSLEHVHEPLEVLRAARKLLAPGGRILVAVPNIASLPFRWFGTAWHGLDVPRHLTHFTPPTLSLMLEKAGFRVCQVRMERAPGWIKFSARLASQDNPEGARRFGRLRNKIPASLASWYCFLTRRSDAIIAIAEKS